MWLLSGSGHIDTSSLLNSQNSAEMIDAICKVFLFVLFLHRCAADVNGRYYPRYHLAPQHGWMNDPNGFSFFQGSYHLFYQYNPDSSQVPGIAHWAHATSEDLCHWTHLPTAMYPDDSYDKTGVFSGSAIVENDTMYIFYTGNVNHPGEEPDHEQHQALATCTDGVNVTKYEHNPIIVAKDRQPNIRDPKVWKHDDTYYMVLGNSFNNDTLGRVLLYTSKNMIDWEEASILDESDGYLGYMWECPDFFELDGKFVLCFSPQGVKPQGDKYRNLYQTGYIIGDFDYDTLSFTALSDFQELDHGHDFYATQTLLDSNGRRLLVAWMDMWENIYPERNDGWTGQMTLIRVLSLSSQGRLIQKPVEELSAIIGTELYSGRGRSGTTVKLEDNAAKVEVRGNSWKNFALHFESSNKTNNVVISYDYRRGFVTLRRGGEDGERRTKWRPTGKLHWKVYIDASSIELFCGEGEVTFTSRFFPDGPVSVRLAGCIDQMTVHGINRTVSVPESF